MIEGHIFTDGIIGRDYAKQIEAQLANLPPNTQKIIHHIRSGGGNVYGGYEGYLSLLKAGKPIKTIIEGQAQSMATFIALAGAEVEMMSPGTFMIHNPFFPDGVSGDADELAKAQIELRQIEDTMANKYAEKTKLPLETVKAMMKKTTRMTPQEAKTAGFVDIVIEPSRIAAIGEELLIEWKNLKTDVMNLSKEFSAFLKRHAVASDQPKAVALNTKDGKVLNIAYEGTDNNFVGKSATLDGVPAEGSYQVSVNGVEMTIVCAGGIVTSAMPAQQQQTAPPPNQNDILKQQLSEIQTKLNALQATEAAKVKAAEDEKARIAAESAKVAEAEKIKADAEKTKGELVVAQEKIAELEKKTVGNENRPEPQMSAYRNPFRSAPQAAEVEQVKKFLYDNGFSWLTQYPGGGMHNYLPQPGAVSILETNFNYTWPGILTTEIFYKPQLLAPAINDMVIVDQGIKDRKQYNLITQLDKILKPYGGCTRVFNNNTLNITNMLLIAKEFQVSESWCKDDFTDQLTGVYNFLASEWLRTGNRSFDPSGTPVNTIIDKILSEALGRDVFRRFSFGAGNSSDDDYNQIDGLWDRLIDSSGQGGYCVVRANAPVTGGLALGVGTLAAGIALTNLELVYAKSTQLLKNLPGKTFWVTRSIWENYYNSLIQINNAGNTEAAYKNLQDGMVNLTYKGIPVRPIDLWDSFLAESDNPLNATTRHLILLTVKENHIFGVENGADLNKIEGWYERKDRKFYYEADMKFGYNYLHCDLSTIAY